MIRIICTEEEKTFLIRSMASSEECPFAGSVCINTSGCRSCAECMKERIEWIYVEPE